VTLQISGTAFDPEQPDLDHGCFTGPRFDVRLILCCMLSPTVGRARTVITRVFGLCADMTPGRVLSLQLDLDFLALFKLERNTQLFHLKEILAGRKRHPADGGVDVPGLAAVT